MQFYLSSISTLVFFVVFFLREIRSIARDTFACFRPNEVIYFMLMPQEARLAAKKAEELRKEEERKRQEEERKKREEEKGGGGKETSRGKREMEGS